MKGIIHFRLNDQYLINLSFPNFFHSFIIFILIFLITNFIIITEMKSVSFNCFNDLNLPIVYLLVLLVSYFLFVIKCYKFDINC